jgi:hypothetical protein
MKKIFLLILLVSFLGFSYNFSPYDLNFSYEKSTVLNNLALEPLEQGKKELKKHKLLILGISRDNAGRIKPVISHIEKLGSQFSDYKVVIFENDSSDGTKLILSIWSLLNSRVNIINEDFNLIKRPSIKFLADIRNKYLNYIKDKYPDFDMALVLDMDMHYGWDMRGVYNSFSQIENWDAVCANGIYTKQGHMWDSFAHRDDNYNLNNLYHDISPDYWASEIPKAQKIYTIGDKLKPVKSCFNGMAFYKRSAISNCQYDSIKGNCEHVSFHSCIINKNHAKIVMNPSMVIYYVK